MRTTTMLIVGLAVLLLITAGMAVWFQNRPSAPPTALQFKQIRSDGSLIAMADGMACPPEMAARRMQLERAKEAFLHLRARYAFTPEQTADLDRSLATFRGIGKRTSATVENCNKVGPQFFDKVVLHMAHL
jgi:hypothetical protein